MRIPPIRRVAALLLLAVTCVVPARAARAAARLAGNVWTVDQETGQVTIIDAGRRITFAYGTDTIIRRGSTNRTVNDLRRGDRVVVTLAEETPDALRARLIAIAGPPAAPGHGFDVFR
jgi:hypothetical protein